MWLPYVATAVSPLGTVAGDITTYVLGYGILGVAAVLFTLRVIVPRSAVEEAKEQARQDLLKEIERLIADKNNERERLVTERTRAEEQRDAALKIAQDQLVPLLTSFVATSQSLIPLLQEVVRDREGRR
jgi:hypothetical protein